MVRFVRDQVVRADIVGKTLRFGLVGGTSFFVHLAVVILIDLIFGAAFWGNVAGYGAATLYQLAMHKFFTFPNKGTSEVVSNGSYAAMKFVMWPVNQLVFTGYSLVLPWASAAVLATSVTTMFASWAWATFVSHRDKT